MKKLSLLIALCMLLTIGGVYATWTYTSDRADVADEPVNMSLNLTGVSYIDTYGTFEIDQSGLSLKIDPAEGTAHITSLLASGELVISFIPSEYAPPNVQESGISNATWKLSIGNTNWTYDSQNIISVLHPDESHDIVWQKSGNKFVFTLTAAEIASHLDLTEFDLETKTHYDEYSRVLGLGSITLTVSDGITPNN